MPRRKKSSNENQSRSSLSINKEKPQQRYAANARERARMRVLSRAFCRLKTTLPWVPADTKLSKLDTLRLAASYIAHLKGILQEEPLIGSNESSLHPAMSMTWPFGFNRPLGGSPGEGSHDGGSLEGSEDDDEDDDGESISSCTWEEVTPTAKDCVHLDTPRRGGGGRARGKGGNNNNSQNSEDKDSSSQLSTKSSATNHGCLNSNTIISNTSRPLSQTTAPFP
ncbi:Transcription factor 21 [Orchesella cincta]|uniref:Transcription factor 21 n=1 Tax=Orchesella cincta TaxID=48709 RepID=A0A1D2MDS0_ORCCI|nr:Transcription factor 21 [Orchesella cincta]